MITTEIDEYVRAYTELNCLLEYLPKNYYSKIPPKFIELIKSKSHDKYKIVVNPEKNLNEHNISRKTRVLLAILKYNYWCESDSDREELRNIFNENEKKYQEELREKYNPNNIFKKNSTDEEDKQPKDLIEYKESVFKKILDRILNFFHIKK